MRRFSRTIPFGSSPSGRSGSQQGVAPVQQGARRKQVAGDGHGEIRKEVQAAERPPRQRVRQLQVGEGGVDGLQPWLRLQEQLLQQSNSVALKQILEKEGLAAADFGLVKAARPRERDGARFQPGLRFGIEHGLQAEQTRGDEVRLGASQPQRLLRRVIL